MVHGQPLAEAGGSVRNQREALEIAADSLARGEVVPERAVALMSKLGIPRWMYVWIGNRRWGIEARRNAAKVRLRDRPFEKSTEAKSLQVVTN